MSITFFYVDAVRKRPTETTNAIGESVKSYVSTSIRGYIGRVGYDEFKTADKWTIESRRTFYSNDSDIKYGDVIFIKDRNYRVITDRKDTSNYGHHFKVFVEKLDNIF